MRLHDGENVLQEVLPSKYWTWSLYVITLGLWAIWRRRHRYILTNQRLISLKGVITKSERVIPLDRIQDLAVRTSPFKGGRIMLSTAGGPLGFKDITRITNKEARTFADAIQHSAKAASASASAPAPALPPVAGNNWQPPST